MLIGTPIGRRRVRLITLADSPTPAAEADTRDSRSNGARMVAKRPSQTRLAAGADECHWSGRASTGKVAVRPQAAMLQARPLVRGLDFRALADQFPQHTANGVLAAGAHPTAARNQERFFASQVTAGGPWTSRNVDASVPDRRFREHAVPRRVVTASTRGGRHGAGSRLPPAVRVRREGASRRRRPEPGRQRLADGAEGT